MTREEAIEVLKKTLPYTSEFADARAIAIKSLEAWEKVKKDIDKSHLGKWYVGRIDGKSEDVIPVEWVYQIIDKHMKEVE